MGAANVVSQMRDMVYHRETALAYYIRYSDRVLQNHFVQCAWADRGMSEAINELTD